METHLKLKKIKKGESVVRMKLHWELEAFTQCSNQFDLCGEYLEKIYNELYFLSLDNHK